MPRTYDLDEDEREYCRVEQMRFILGDDDYYGQDGKEDEPEEGEDEDES